MKKKKIPFIINLTTKEGIIQLKPEDIIKLLDNYKVNKVSIEFIYQ